MTQISTRLSAAAFAFALLASFGCGDMGCGDSSSQYGKKTSEPAPVTCGTGTILQAGVCVPAQSIQTNMNTTTQPIR